MRAMSKSMCSDALCRHPVSLQVMHMDLSESNMPAHVYIPINRTAIFVPGCRAWAGACLRSFSGVMHSTPGCGPVSSSREDRVHTRSHQSMTSQWTSGWRCCRMHPTHVLSIHQRWVHGVCGEQAYFAIVIERCMCSCVSADPRWNQVGSCLL